MQAKCTIVVTRIYHDLPGIFTHWACILTQENAPMYIPKPLPKGAPCPPPTKNELWTSYVTAKEDYLRGDIDAPELIGALNAWRAAS
jgi:hypothetical protein